MAVAYYRANHHSIYGDLSVDYEPKPGVSKEERLATIETIVGRMEQRLFGNGQEGELSKIKGRITKLEEFKWKLLGAASLLIVGFELLKILLK